jgi:predicted secreted protein
VSLIRTFASSLWKTLAAIVVLSVLGIAAAVKLFGLTIGGATALYFVVWWTILFVVLPFNIRSQAETGEIAVGTEPGAPASPALRVKAIWTTLLAVVGLLVLVAVMPLAGL